MEKGIIRTLSIFIILMLCITTVGVTADSDFSIELDNSIDVPPQSVQGVTADQFAVVKPGSQITGQATGPAGVDYFIGFARPDGSREIIGNTRTGGTAISIPTDDAEVGTHVVAAATGTSRDDVQAAQPVVIEAYDVTTSSADGFETTTESQLNVSATLSKHDGVTSSIDDVEAVVWNETYQKRVSMTQDGTLEYETAISDLPAGEFSLSVIVRSENTNDLIDRNDAIGVSDPKAVNVDSASNFSVDIARSPANVTAGDSFDVRANISNTGTAEGTKDVALTFAGRTADIEHDVTLPPGSSQEVTLTGDTTENDTGEQTVEIQAGNGTDSRVITVETAPPSPANFQVTVSEANSTAHITPNETATIVADVENTGDETDTQEIVFELDGRSLRTENVTLGDGDIQTIDFAYNTSNNPVEIGEQLNFTVVSENNSDTFTATVVEDAFFDLTIVNAPTEVTENDEITVNYEIENTGGVSDTQTIALTINGTEQRTTRLTVANDSKVTNSFSYIASDEDVPRIELGIKSEDTTATTPITVNEDAFFDVTITDVPGTVTEGGEVTVGYSVTNTGGVRDTQDISFAINGSTRDTAGDIALSPGGTTHGSFKYVTDTDDLPSITTSVASDNDFATERVQVAEVGVLNVSIDEAASSLSVRDTETIIVSANVTNTGDVPLEQDITANVAGTTQATNSSLKIPSGETETLKFEFEARSDFDGQAVNVSSANTSDAATLNVDTVGELAVSINTTRSDLEVGSGELVSVVADITNTGDVKLSQDIAAVVNNKTQATANNVTVVGNTTKFVRLNFTGQPGFDDQTVTVESDNTTAVGTLKILEPAAPRLSDLDIAGQEMNAELVEGDNKSVRVDLENTGEAEGEFNVTLTAGNVTQTESVALGGGANQTISFTNATGKLPSGEYTVTVTSSDNSLEGTLMIREPTTSTNVNISETNSTIELLQNETLTLNATIENTGDRTGITPVEFRLVSATGTSKLNTSTSVTLAGGENTTVSFNVTDTSALRGNYTAEISTETTADSVNVTVNKPADFDVDISNSRSDRTILPGDPLRLTVNIENIGDVAGEQTIVGAVAGREQATTVTVDANSSESVALNFTGTDTDTIEPGDYVVTVTSEGSRDTLNVSVRKPPTIEIDAVEPVRNNIVAGDTIVLNATITNTGEVTAEQEIALQLGAADSVVDTTNVKIGAANTSTVQLVYNTTTNDIGGLNFTIVSENDESTVSVNVLEQAEFDVVINSTSSTQSVRVGETIIINATITNRGEADDRQDIKFNYRGASRSRSVALSGNESTTVEFTYEARTHDIGENRSAIVASEDDTETIRFDVFRPAVFDVEVNKTASVTEVSNGEAIQLVATVENRGTRSGTQNVTLAVAGNVVNTSADLTLAGGETTQVNLAYQTTGDNIGEEVPITVSSLNDSTRITASVTPVRVSLGGGGGSAAVEDPAFFTVSNLTLNNSTINQSKTLTASATIKNTGGRAGSQTVELRVDGNVIASKQVTLGGGRQMIFEVANISTVSFGNDTEYVISTDDDSTRATVTIEPSASGSYSGENRDNDDAVDNDADTPVNGDDSDAGGDNSDTGTNADEGTTGSDSSGTTSDRSPGFDAVIGLFALIVAAFFVARKAN